jgi:hypothetical protein
MLISTRNRPKTPPQQEARKNQRMMGASSYNTWPTFLFDVMQEIIKTQKLPALSIQKIMQAIQSAELTLNMNEPSTALLDRIALINPQLFLAQLEGKDHLCLNLHWVDEDQRELYLKNLKKPLREWITANFDDSRVLCQALQSGRLAVINRLNALPDVAHDDVLIRSDI